MPPVPHITGLFSTRRLNRLYLLSLIAAFSLAVLFTNLGVYPLWGSEGRWAVVGRYMFQSGDIFNPMLGISPYWDKPLVSYWQILPFAYVLGGVSELSARMPSSLWACILLLLTYDLARRWFGRGSALLATAVLTTSYGFVFWGRNAQVEMTNAAVTMLVLWYFLTRRQAHGHAWLFLLALLMGIGANMKGLTAVGVPIFCILLLSAFMRDWKWLPGPRAAVQAVIVFTAAFLLIPLISCAVSSSCDPLRLIWKENAIRYFEPFDHRGAFYIYLYRIFDLAAPWSALLPLSLFTYLGHGRHREVGVRNALLISLGIFLFFTLSGSRRPYYLLPILPFTSILIGDFMFRFIGGHLPLKTGLAVKLTGFLMGAALMGPLAVFMFGSHMLPQGIEVLFPWSILIAACGMIMMVSFFRRYIPGMIAPVGLVWLVFVFAVIPWASSLPGNIRTETAKLNAMGRPVGFLSSDDAKTVFYLKRPYTVLPDISQARIWAERTGGVLIAHDPVPDLSWQTVIDEGAWKALVLRKSSQYSKRSPPLQQAPTT